jgi:protein-S-isoprenylcysteine O-methyltransferase Ste14
MKIDKSFLLPPDHLIWLAFFLYMTVHHHGRACLIGAAIALPGFVLWILARFQLGSSFAVTAQARQLVTHGLYSKIRNPIYFFATFAILGTAICVNKPIFYGFIMLLTLLQMLRVRNEERVLEAKFGEAYRDYRRRTWF